MKILTFFILVFSQACFAQQKLKDIFQGNESSEPRDMVNTPNHNFFLDKLSLLYETDGTESGTVQVTDPQNSSFPFPQITQRTFSKAGDNILFRAYQTGANYAGQELWISDGTPAGTVEVDISPGTSSSTPTNFIPISDSLTIFFAFVGVNQEIWVTNGTPAGTQRLFDFNPGDQATFYDYLLHEGKIYMEMIYGYPNPDSLWVSDGTPAGTINLGEFQIGQDIESIGSEVFFTANSGGSDFELWKTDGTVAGTMLVKDIEPGTNQYSYPRYFQKLNNKILFAPGNGIQKEIWVTDGTEAGTVVVSDINPFGSSSPSHLKTLNNDVLFTATDYVIGRELYKSNGTMAGTTLLKDINPNSTGNINDTFDTSADEIFMGPVNGFLFFLANDGTHGMELWRTDGTTAGTQMVADINQSSTDSDIKNFSFFDDQIIFNAQKPDGTYDLFLSDGNTVQTFFAAYGVTSLSNPYILGESSNGELFFTAFSPAYGYELFKVSNGAISLVKDIRTTPTEDFLNYDREAFVATSGDNTYFLRNDNEHGIELWSTDGTTANTNRLTDFDPYPVNIPTFGNFSYLGTAIPGLSTFIDDQDKLYFQIDRELYKVENGNVSLFWSSSVSNIFNLSKVGNKIQWIVRDSLFSYDGSAISSHYIDATNYQSPQKLDIINLDGKSFFFYQSSLYGYEPYIFDPATGMSTLVKDITSGTSYVFMREVVGSGSKAFFTNNSKLYVSDGSTGGTFEIPISGSLSNTLYKLRSLGDGRITFTVRENMYGQEVWVSDGTIAGTKIIKDLNNSPNGSISNANALNYTVFSKSNDRVWFPALGNIYSTDGDSIYLEVSGVNFQDIYAHQGRAYNYCTNCGTDGREPFSAAKNSFHLIMDVNPGPGDSYPTSFIGNGNNIFFFARDASGIFAPYMYESCPSELIEKNEIANSTTIKAEYSIEGKVANTIKANQTVTYDAGAYILLKPGFKTESGSVFKTQLIGCSE